MENMETFTALYAIVNSMENGKYFLILKVTVDLRGVCWGKQYSALCINGKYINLYIIGELYNWLHVCGKICLV